MVFIVEEGDGRGIGRVLSGMATPCTALQHGGGKRVTYLVLCAGSLATLGCEV